MNNETTPILWGGYGSLCNNDTQYHQQNRIYDGEHIAIAITTCCLPYYLIRTMKEEKITCEHIMNLNYYKHEESDRVYSGGGTSPTITTKGKDDARGIKIAEYP